jgi:hypothetical protein
MGFLGLVVCLLPMSKELHIICWSLWNSEMKRPLEKKEGMNKFGRIIQWMVHMFNIPEKM